MLYRFRPDGSSEWIDLPGRHLFRIVDEHGGNLDSLEWLPAERRTDADTLRMALRHGRPSSVGIILDGGELADVDHPRRIREAHADALATRPAYRKALEQQEAFWPGTLAAEEKSAAEVDASIAESLAEADAQLEAALKETAPRTALVDHWVSLGGPLPQPL